MIKIIIKTFSTIIIINHTHHFLFSSRPALGIGAASFWSVAEKDIAESPTAEPERLKSIHN